MGPGTPRKIVSNVYNCIYLPSKGNGMYAIEFSVLFLMVSKPHSGLESMNDHACHSAWA